MTESNNPPAGGPRGRLLADPIRSVVDVGFLAAHALEAATGLALGEQSTLAEALLAVLGLELGAVAGRLLDERAMAALVSLGSQEQAPRSRVSWPKPLSRPCRTLNRYTRAGDVRACWHTQAHCQDPVLPGILVKAHSRSSTGCRTAGSGCGRCFLSDRSTRASARTRVPAPLPGAATSSAWTPWSKTACWSPKRPGFQPRFPSGSPLPSWTPGTGPVPSALPGGSQRAIRPASRPSGGRIPGSRTGRCTGPSSPAMGSRPGRSCPRASPHETRCRRRLWRHAEKIDQEVALQVLFFRQWETVRAHARSGGSPCSATSPSSLRAGPATSGLATASADAPIHSGPVPDPVTGVPPDFSLPTDNAGATPPRLACSPSRGLSWWVARLEGLLSLVDEVRIDHFRGLVSAWEIPHGAASAKEGAWAPGPGRALLDTLLGAVGRSTLFVEDLGDITPDVHALRDALGLPGMKILQFAFNGDPDHPFKPHNWTHPRWVAYTGTHDNNTSGMVRGQRPAHPAPVSVYGPQRREPHGT